MKYAAALVAALATSVSAHATVFGLWVNGEFQGDGRNTYIRSPNSNSPIKDVESQNINCNDRNRAVPQFVNVNPGDTVDIEWFHDNRNDDIIDGSHKGPILTYLAPAASNGNGAVWTKIQHAGFANGRWAVDDLKANQGRYSVTIPAGLAPGDYLLRSEIIAHHESDTDFKVNPARGAQFYPSCSQIRVGGNGNVVLNQNFNFVGGYKSNAPGILFNLYEDDPTTYTIPGPAVFSAGAGGNNPAPAPAPAPQRPTTTSAPVVSATPPPANNAPATVTVTVTVNNQCNGGAVPAPAPTGNVGATAVKYGQCGGRGFNGPTRCPSGTTCRVQNEYYSQCL